MLQIMHNPYAISADYHQKSSELKILPPHWLKKIFILLCALLEDYDLSIMKQNSCCARREIYKNIRDICF